VLTIPPLHVVCAAFLRGISGMQRSFRFSSLVPRGLVVESVTCVEGTIVVEARAQGDIAKCPLDESVLGERSRRTGRLDHIVHHLGLALGAPAASFARRLATYKARIVNCADAIQPQFKYRSRYTHIVGLAASTKNRTAAMSKLLVILNAIFKTHTPGSAHAATQNC
jgi:hypothetical protein